jgi:hypothetical protein
MANAKTVMVLCNILKLSKSQKHIIRKTPKITKEGQQQPFAKSYFKRFSYFPQLFLTKKQQNRHVSIHVLKVIDRLSSLAIGKNCATKDL